MLSGFGFRRVGAATGRGEALRRGAIGKVDIVGGFDGAFGEGAGKEVG